MNFLKVTWFALFQHRGPECPLLAHSGHPWLQCTCPISGVKRTCGELIRIQVFCDELYRQLYSA